MKAVVKWKEGAGSISFAEWPAPVPGPGEVQIDVAYAGICGTDLKIRSGDYWSNPPVVLGHEYSGFVSDTGEGVTDLKLGDPVVSETAQVVCGKCEYCLSGNFLMCDGRLSIGYGTDGAFGDSIAVRRAIVHQIPEGVSMREAAMCEPAAVALHAVFDYAQVLPTDTVLVFGPGTIGQLVAQAARSLGASVVLCGTEADAFRLEIAERLGFTVTAAGAEELQSFVDQLTGGKGADWAFECSGAAPAVSLALRCLKKQGVLVQVGLTKPNIPLDYGLVAMRELTIRGAFGHRNVNWNQALQMMAAKQIDVDPLITDEFSFEEWEEAFDKAEKLHSIKVLLHP
ncbi:zinc-dependent alcohol dehydrogenase [Bacilliculturomica massiliensis]|uniref:zinc-dependent alcohol dehydrogenase n=1 Tax=Bacilliculturomica massiliensis TaxID=1917867 RepID=UPI001030E465|nr:zinc-binding dehydrogenase [Bacilliculturomica massiliensis]